MKLLNNLAIITLAAAVGYGCSSSSSTPPPTPNGIYSGTVTGGVGAPFNGDEKGIIYNGRYMIFTTVLDIQQLFDAQLVIVGSSFTTTVSNYNNNSSVRFTADLSGNFTTNASVDASFTSISPRENFTDGNINLVADTATYNKGSSPTAVTGSWQGTHGNINNETFLTIDVVGNITAGTDAQGCNFTGTVIPADTSVNVYNVTLVSTGGTGCTSLPTATYTGLAWTEGATDATLNFTVADGINSRSVILTKN